jgi:hypothetical protein
MSIQFANAVPAPISAASARLPQTYETAKTALANCAQLDECQDWADKAAALASYAKQANDDEMMKMAVRIRDRAIRRAGELLKQIEPQPGKRTDVEPSGGAPTRLQVAKDAGMSRDQMHTAIRVANVPAEDFEKQVESQTPPTVTALAEQGKKAAPKPVIDLKGRDPGEFNRALHFVGAFEGYQRDIEKIDADAILPILTDGERERVRAAIAAIDAFHDRIITRI